MTEEEAVAVVWRWSVARSRAIQDSEWTEYGDGLQLECEEEKVALSGYLVSDMHNRADCGTITKQRQGGVVCVGLGNQPGIWDSFCSPARLATFC